MHKNIIVRLVTYYVAVIFVMTSLFAAFPVLGRYLAAERARQGARAALEIDQPAPSTPFAPALAGPAEWFDAERSVPVVLSLFAALLVTVPVVWVYRWTRPHRRYNQNFAHTLLVVPIAITLVVFLVKGSLALAFSLAGIVAAVRFRTALEEPLDAVYLFLVIGTGLAAGVQLLFVALIASMLFNAVALAVWGLDVGSRAAVIEGWRLVETGPKLPFPAAPPSAASPAPGGGSTETGEAYNTKLRLHATDVEDARRFAAAFLDERAKLWRAADVAREPDGTATLEFDLRLKKSADLAAFVREIEGGNPHITRVELTRVKSNKLQGA